MALPANGASREGYERVVAPSTSPTATPSIAPATSCAGPLDMSRFLLILSRMNANLSESWRVDVQRAGLTRRDEAQTLEIVRAGTAGRGA